MPLDINYTPAPVQRKFMASDARMRVLMGPVGSGKSVTCCFEVVRRASMQAPNAQGIRKSVSSNARPSTCLGAAKGASFTPENPICAVALAVAPLGSLTTTWKLAQPCWDWLKSRFGMNTTCPP